MYSATLGIRMPGNYKSTGKTNQPRPNFQAVIFRPGPIANSATIGHDSCYVRFRKLPAKTIRWQVVSDFRPVTERTRDDHARGLRRDSRTDLPGRYVA
ncbi:MAG: hypothetical protein V2I25_13125, partial [Woeseiaceae bacterium]|nr:hypothetical protein [Woeseiaceae bacterium]